ncbi:hypothetical protein Tsubulata_006666 [Turnera subulata]|uniref:KHG/KDPG aldolase n=1 Tax=Turnera subulata TaxID=218843 RepID=A0A9Q0FMW2_9ROSI|nr:hypothetical protein Tsubulata_006666 [Turnera subulata]
MDMGVSSLWSLSPLSFPQLSPKFKSSRVCCASPSFFPSPTTTHKTLTLIQNSGVIACLRANSAELAYEAASAALRGGITVLEIVMSTPGVLQVLRQLVQDHPSLALGVGTVLNIGDAKNAINAGAKFLISPASVKDIMDDIRDLEALYIPGVMTPTEILSAYAAGAKVVKTLHSLFTLTKVYPVSALGGIRYISALKKPFPHIPMVASQGITVDSIGDYISAGATSVVLSDAIFNKDAMLGKKFTAIHNIAHLAALKGKEAVTLIFTYHWESYGSSIEFELLSCRDLSSEMY